MTPQHANDLDSRRKSVRRTVLWLALAAIAVYAAFLLAGYYGFAGGAPQ
jgi:hypothetical protein